MPRVQKPIFTLAILTSGGDSPGMNTAIWAATQQLEDSGWRVLGVRGGFAGVLAGDFVELNASECLKFARYGGTFLGTSRDPDFAQKIPAAIKQLKKAGVTHLLVLGGNGSLRGAAVLEQAGFSVVGLPATIDNDVAGSDDSIGFDTATNYGLQILDQFRDTLEALPRLCALETLGGDTGFLADSIGRVGGADAVLVPEIDVSTDILAAVSSDAIQRRGYAMIVASEGVPNLESKLLELEKQLDLRLRFARPSHSMRGGQPSAHDRNLAYDLATAGVNALARGQTGMIAWKNGVPKLLAFSSIPAKKRFKRAIPGG
jgi:6-phosphofructokinase 1